MEPIIKMLTDSGIDALNLSLRGHGQNYDHHAHSDPARARLAAFKSVSYQLWMDEVCSAYAAARNRSDKKNVPLFLIGYSLGGLLGADLLITDPGVQFDKMVLFAPAVKMHLRNYLIRALSPFPRLTIPSFALASYQSSDGTPMAGDGTPMAGYNALFDSLNNVAGNIGPKINVPTLVFIDPEDEIVSYSRQKQMVQDNNLDQWQFYIVQKGGTEEPAKIHHLIIDAPSTGESVWRKMMEAMVNHLYH
jgi:alpha-beta hydrolase superfamily lysophospholipase